MKKTPLLAAGVGVVIALAGTNFANAYYPYPQQPYYPAQYGYSAGYRYPQTAQYNRQPYGYQPHMQRPYPRQHYQPNGYYHPTGYYRQPYPYPYRRPAYRMSAGGYSQRNAQPPNYAPQAYRPQPGRASVNVAPPNGPALPPNDEGTVIQEGSGTRGQPPVQSQPAPAHSAEQLPAPEPVEASDDESLEILDEMPHYEGQIIEETPTYGVSRIDGNCAAGHCESGKCQRIYKIAPKQERLWVSGEYLLWFITDGPTIPLATTSLNPLDEGIIGAPTTSTVLGNDKFNYDFFNGGRVSLGMWFDEYGKIGIEGSGFLLEQNADGLTVNSGPTGLPLLAVPFTTLAGVEDAFAVAQPDAGGLVPATGAVAVTSNSQFWGADATGVLNLFRMCECGDCWFHFDLLGGFTYRDLEEDLEFGTFSNRTPGAADSFASTSVDRFSTRNQFFGGHIGTRMKLRYWRLGLDLTGKVAFGATHQRIGVNGISTFAGTGAFAGAAPGTSPFGVYSQPSNIGSRTDDDFTVLPEGQIRVSFAVFKWLQLFVGYDAMYWGGVVRPGDQIDRTINAPGNIFVGGLQAPGSMAAPPQPAPQDKESNVWIHGVSFGIRGSF